MSQIVLNVEPELLERVNDWCERQQQSPEDLVAALLEEYFEECDETDRPKIFFQAGVRRSNFLQKLLISNNFFMLNTGQEYSIYKDFFASMNLHEQE